MTLKTKIEDYLANFEDLTLIFEEIEDSFMCREPQQIVFIGAIGHAESKSGRIFVLSLLLHCQFGSVFQNS